MLQHSVQTSQELVGNKSGATPLPTLRRSAVVLRGLRFAEWVLLLEMMSLLGTLIVLQRRLPLPELMARFDSKPARSWPGPMEPKSLTRLVSRLVRVILRDHYCMKRSIIIFHYLRKWGYDARLRFGVAKEDGTLQGHAWVELDGEPLSERPDPRRRYAVTYSYPAPAPAAE